MFSIWMKLQAILQSRYFGKPNWHTHLNIKLLICIRPWKKKVLAHMFIQHSRLCSFQYIHWFQFFYFFLFNSNFFPTFISKKSLQNINNKWSIMIWHVWIMRCCYVRITFNLISPHLKIPSEFYYLLSF